MVTYSNRSKRQINVAAPHALDLNIKCFRTAIFLRQALTFVTYLEVFTRIALLFALREFLTSKINLFQQKSEPHYSSTCNNFWKKRLLTIPVGNIANSSLIHVALYFKTFLNGITLFLGPFYFHFAAKIEIYFLGYSVHRVLSKVPREARFCLQYRYIMNAKKLSNWFSILLIFFVNKRSWKKRCIYNYNVSACSHYIIHTKIMKETNSCKIFYQTPCTNYGIERWQSNNMWRWTDHLIRKTFEKYFKRPCETRVRVVSSGFVTKNHFRSSVPEYIRARVLLKRKLVWIFHVFLVSHLHIF